MSSCFQGRVWEHAVSRQNNPGRHRRQLLLTFHRDTPSSHSQGTRSLCHRTHQEEVGAIWFGVLNAEIGRCSCTSGGLNAHVDTHTLKAELCLQRSRVQLERIELVEPAVSELVQRCGGSNSGGQKLSRRHQAQTSVFARPRSVGQPSLVVLQRYREARELLSQHPRSCLG